MKTNAALALASALASFNCAAIDGNTASLMAADAKYYAHLGNADAAFTKLEPLLRDPSPAVQQFAVDVLRSRPMIATAKLGAVTREALAAQAATDGIEQARQAYGSLIEDLYPYADPAAAERALAEFSSVFANHAVAVAAVEEFTLTRAAREEEAAARRAVEAAGEAKRKAAAEELATKEAPKKLRALEREEFCVQYGHVVRGNVLGDYELVRKPLHLFDAEAKRRGLSVNKSLVKDEKIRLRINACTLYASWGEPDDINRTVGPWGVHEQLIFGSVGPYVYLENGVVSSWQD